MNKCKHEEGTRAFGSLVRCVVCGDVVREISSVDPPDPFELAKQIRRGERDDEIPSFEVLTGWLGRVPMTWLPALLVRTVVLCVTRKVFLDNDALVRTVQRAAEQGPESFLRHRPDAKSGSGLPVQYGKDPYEA